MVDLLLEKPAEVEVEADKAFVCLTDDLVCEVSISRQQYSRCLRSVSLGNVHMTTALRRLPSSVALFDHAVGQLKVPPLERLI